MRKTIRYNTFETNSSSAHALVVKKDSCHKYNPDEVELENWGYDGFDLFGFMSEGDYGRAPFEILSSPIEKLRYYVAYHIGTLNKMELKEDVIDFIHKQTNIPKDKIKIHKDRHYHGADKIVQEYGHVDHQSIDILGYLENNKISMEEFVLNPKYIVIIDGDEYCKFEELCKTGLIDRDSLEYLSCGIAKMFNETHVIDWSYYRYSEKGPEYEINQLNKHTKKIHINVSTKLNDEDRFAALCILKNISDHVAENRPDIVVDLLILKDLKNQIKEIQEYITNISTIYVMKNIWWNEYEIDDKKVDEIIKIGS